MLSDDRRHDAPFSAQKTQRPTGGVEGVYRPWLNINNFMQVSADRTWLRAVEVNIIDHEVCEFSLLGIKPITPRMVCAGVPGGGKTACSRDTGGPLVLKKSGKQVGIYFYAFGCASNADFPGVYTKVADKEIRDFIDGELQQVATSPNGSDV